MPHSRWNYGEGPRRISNMRKLTFWAIALGLLATFPAEDQRFILPASGAEFASFYSVPASRQGSGASESLGGPR